MQQIPAAILKAVPGAEYRENCKRREAKKEYMIFLLQFP